MSDQGETLAKLSKTKKKKKSAQKKKLAKQNARAQEERAAAGILEQKCNEADARMVEQFHDKAMFTRDFQMLNIRGKLLVHPSKSFLDAFTTLRQDMGRDTYPNRIHHARRLFYFGNNIISFSSWAMAMGLSPFSSNKSPTLPQPRAETHTDQGSKEGAIVNKSGLDCPTSERRWLSSGVFGLMVWYPVFAICMTTGDKLACIALRDTCSLLRTCYGIFRNDITRLEQFVFDVRNPATIKQVDWVARRIEVPPSPPQTPPHEYDFEAAVSNADRHRDPFRSPIVEKKRWADYDDDDESLGSPMSLPITPESLNGSDVPVLDLNGSSVATKQATRRPPTVVVAIPTLTDNAPWFSTTKTVLPVPRLSLYTFEDFPRPQRTTSALPMKLQSSAIKYISKPSSATVRVRARLEHWVREDLEKNLKAKLSLGLSSAGKKMANAQTESVVFNRMAALATINNGQLGYIGEPDILGSGTGLTVEDVRDVVTGRFRPENGGGESEQRDGSRTWSECWSEDAKSVKIMLVPGAEGWICSHLSDLQSQL